MQMQSLHDICTSIHAVSAATGNQNKETHFQSKYFSFMNLSKEIKQEILKSNIF